MTSESHQVRVTAADHFISQSRIAEPSDSDNRYRNNLFHFFCQTDIETRLIFSGGLGDSSGTPVSAYGSMNDIGPGLDHIGEDGLHILDGVATPDVFLPRQPNGDGKIRADAAPDFFNDFDNKS